MSIYKNVCTEGDDTIDFLSPFGQILVNQRDEEDGAYDCSDLLAQYCTNPINSSVTRHRGSEIDEILRGHRSQGPPTKPPGESKIGVRN